jgi:XTP/dITP diphosphohydrolase
MKKVVLASGNAGKLREFSKLLSGSGLQCVPQTAFGVPDAVEDGLSFVENAIKKARNASRHTHLPALADDSGLEVEALEGQPGIYSARFAGPDAGDAANTERLLERMRDLPPERRAARFVCVIVYMRHALDPVPIVCTGTWDGRILDTPRGENGFGYDPVFGVGDSGRSAAELTAEQKNAVSHRAKALRCLRDQLGATRAHP